MIHKGLLSPGRCLTFDTTGCKAADQILFDTDEQYYDRNDGIQGSCEQILPFNHVVTVEDINTNGQRLEGICGDQGQCYGVFIPCIDKYENQCRYDTRCCNWKQDLEPPAIRIEFSI